MYKYEITNVSNHDIIIKAVPEGYRTGFIFKGHYHTFECKWDIDVLFNGTGLFNAEDCARAILEEEVRIAIPDYRFDLARDIKRILA